MNKVKSLQYKYIKDISEDQVRELLLSVNWPSANSSFEVKNALQDSTTVISVWDEEKLVGLLNCISDNYMVAYIHFLVVNPDYHGYGVGKKMLSLTMNIYSSCKKIIVIALKESVDFYSKYGFEIQDDKIAMFKNQ